MGCLSAPCACSRPRRRKRSTPFGAPQEAIVLGDGDRSRPGGGTDLSSGTCYEGAIVAGSPSGATDDAAQADVTAADQR
ncbi:arabinofuranosidase catalytic domain-containing protein [Streptomyces alanosinicus]|nr:arabinofuranosidase catalytic domain-containing protein [Streptomyces alanosinicus]